VAVTKGARWWPSDLPGDGHQTCPRWLQGGYSFSCDGLGEADAVAAGLADVGVVDEPVDGGGGQGFRHELVEYRRVEIRADRDAAALVGGVDEAVESLGGVGPDGQEPDVVDLCGHPHRSTYADTATMPRILGTSLVRGPGGGRSSA
jgi:hypothetical protein